MKDILSKRRRLGEFELGELSEECSAVVQRNLPQKLKDPGSFTIPCMLGEEFCCKALIDLGASINLMPYSVFQQLGLKDMKPTKVTL
jgi:hypothetical protein